MQMGVLGKTSQHKRDAEGACRPYLCVPSNLLRSFFTASPMLKAAAPAQPICRYSSPFGGSRADSTQWRYET